MIISLQYCKLVREQKENAREWMGHLRMKANKCSYREKHIRLKEHFINGIHNDDMITEVIRKLIAVKTTMESPVSKGT